MSEQKTNEKEAAVSRTFDPLVMPPNLKTYGDENDLIDEFCERMNCNICAGCDYNGEPNGYGCPAMEAWTEKYADRINDA